MLNNTLKLIVVLLVYLNGLIFSLILLYASPDNLVHSFESSLFFCSSVLILFALSYNLSFKNEPNNLMKYAYLFVFMNVLLSAITLALICVNAHPMDGITDIKAMYIFFFSGLLMTVGLAKMLLTNRRASNA